MVARKANHIGELLLTAREAVGFRRSELARHVGLDPSYIYRLEVGDRRPSRESILAIAEVVKAESEATNKWLTAAGYAPLPLLAMVRAAGEIPLERSHRGKLPADREAARWANWLEAMGLQELTVKRLLQAIETVGLVQQQRVVKTISATISCVTEMLEAPIGTAVIPAAGGQHQLVAPHVMQRLLLGAIAEAADSGVSKVVLILAPGMVDSIYSPLKTALDLAVVPHVELLYCEQALPQGLGDAVLQAEALVDGKPFAVLLPDDVIRQRVGRSTLPSEFRRMVEFFRRLGDVSLIAVTSLPKAKMSNYGIAKVGAKAVISNVRPITQLVEKPDHAHPILRSPRAFGIVGRYLMQPDIFLSLRKQKEEALPRLQLTDALERLRREGGRLHAVEMKAQRQDIGEMLGRASELIGVPPTADFG
jgi:UTP--glucose-1-phosphate uridylyltransferase